MIDQLSITVLVDNRAGENGIGTEHGLSLWIEADGYKLLFDTGQSDLLFRNAKLLKIDPTSADALVLSHGHYDHTGGLARLLEISPVMQVHCHPAVVVPRYSRKDDGSMKPVGISRASALTLMRNEKAIYWTAGPRYITDHIGITGVIPRKTAFEDTGGAFYSDPEGNCSDAIDDDIAIWIETVKGIVVIVGCCHSGIINTISRISAITDGTTLHGLVGGLHLVNAHEKRLEATIAALANYEWTFMMPCHCTDNNAMKRFRREFPERVEPGFAGKVHRTG